MENRISHINLITATLLILVMVFGSISLVGCNQDDSQESSVRKMTDEDESKDSYSLTNDEIKSYLESTLDDDYVPNNMSPKQYETWKHYNTSFEYYGDTLYDIEVSEYSNPGDHIFMFPTVTEIIQDGGSSVDQYALLLDPREEYYITDWKYRNGAITAQEHLWGYPNDADEVSPYSITKEKGLSFLKDNDALNKNDLDEYNIKAGDRIISLNFVGVVKKEDYDEIINMPLTVAVDDYRNQTMFVKIPSYEHQFKNVKKVTFEELDRLFSLENCRL